MIIEFQGENTGSIIMFGNVATTLLKMMGQSGEPQGAIRQEDIPEALSKLNNALQSVPDDSTDTDKDTEENEDDNSVGLKTRAVPLVDMLEECVAKGGYVMWKPQ
jgi:hypothetical protein